MFKKACPVWIPQANPQEKLNTNLVFYAVADHTGDTVLRLAAADFYKLYINGKMVGFGPARTAKGYARVDEYPLPAGRNELMIEVAGYYCRSLSTVRQDSFFIAEVLAEGQPLLYTGRDFTCRLNSHREKKVERYSVQRHFGEVYTYNGQEDPVVQTVAVAQSITFIPRRVPYADLTVTQTEEYAVQGTFCPAKELPAHKNAYSFAVDRELDWGYFKEAEIKDKPFRYILAQDLTKTAGAGKLPVTLQAGEWVMFDLNKVEVGFLQVAATAQEDSQLILAFCELCPANRFVMSSMNAQTVLQYNIAAGERIFNESFEPYSFGKAALFVKQGQVTVTGFGFRTFMRDMRECLPHTFKDPQLAEIYEGAKRTFAHNAVDLFTDCPSRERAGWLCDTFFTGRAEYFLFGKTPIEDAFLENYVLYQNEGEFPQGVLPMCYPSDPHGNNKFIPQWDMWYVLEVCEYLTRRNPQADKERFRPSVVGVLNFLKKYENEQGLLERLPSWNFVEWSKANDWTQDINYPTNMLYAQVLESAGEVFGLAGNGKRAERVRAAVTAMAFNGEVFVDHAIRNEDGVLENAPHVSEAGQYYAALFGKLDLDSAKFTAFKAGLQDGFTAFASRRKDMEFCAVDAFIGFYLRLNVLLEMGDPALMDQNLKAFFGGMCATTGTLWEYKTPHKSLDHGFASYAAVTLPLADSNFPIP